MGDASRLVVRTSPRLHKNKGVGRCWTSPMKLHASSVSCAVDLVGIGLSSTIFLCIDSFSVFFFLFRIDSFNGQKGGTYFGEENFRWFVFFLVRDVLVFIDSRQSAGSSVSQRYSVAFLGESGDMLLEKRASDFPLPCRTLFALQRLL